MFSSNFAYIMLLLVLSLFLWLFFFFLFPRIHLNIQRKCTTGVIHNKDYAYIPIQIILQPHFRDQLEMLLPSIHLTEFIQLYISFIWIYIIYLSIENIVYSVEKYFQNEIITTLNQTSSAACSMNTCFHIL